MRKLITPKHLIIAAFITYMLYLFGKIYIDLALRQSIDAAAGFLMGLLFALLLYIQIKCIGYLYGEAREWLGRRRARRARIYGVER